MGRTVAGDVGDWVGDWVGDGLESLDELGPAVLAELAMGESALGESAKAAASVRRNEDQELVVDELEPVEVLPAVEPGGQLPVEFVMDEPERRGVVVAGAMRSRRPPAGAQTCCPGSTRGRPGNRSSIEFVWT